MRLVQREVSHYGLWYKYVFISNQHSKYEYINRMFWPNETIFRAVAEEMSK